MSLQTHLESLFGGEGLTTNHDNNHDDDDDNHRSHLQVRMRSLSFQWSWELPTRAVCNLAAGQ